VTELGAFITGPPGVGKTTLVVKVVERLRAMGVGVTGFYTIEAREQGTRVGFRLVNVNSGEWRWLAHVSAVEGPMVGRYHVNVDAVEWGLTLLNEPGDLYVIDEVGPMEMKHPLFLTRVEDVVKSRHFIVTVHVRMTDWLLSRSSLGRVFRLSYVNRDAVASDVLNYLRGLITRVG
jgi:nucleoside-triphosphatase